MGKKLDYLVCMAANCIEQHSNCVEHNDYTMSTMQADRAIDFLREIDEEINHHFDKMSLKVIRAFLYNITLDLMTFKKRDTWHGKEWGAEGYDIASQERKFYFLTDPIDGELNTLTINSALFRILFIRKLVQTRSTEETVKEAWHAFYHLYEQAPAESNSYGVLVNSIGKHDVFYKESINDIFVKRTDSICTEEEYIDYIKAFVSEEEDNEEIKGVEWQQ